MEKQTSFDKQLDSLTDLLSEMETRGPFNPKVQRVADRKMSQRADERENDSRR